MAEIGFASLLNVITKHIYEDGLVKQMIVGAPFMDWIPKKKIDLGSDMSFSIGTSFPEGLGNRTDRQRLQDATAPDFLLPNYDVIDTYQKLEITGKEIERTNNPTKATFNYLVELLNLAKENNDRDNEGQAFADGTGVRGVTTSDTAAGTAVTVTMTTAYTPLTRVRRNMVVDFYLGTAFLTTSKVTSVDTLAGTFVVDDLAVDLPTGVSVYMSGNYNNELNGLQYLVNDNTGPATVLGISSTEPLWRSQVLGNSGTARILTTNLLDQLHFLIKNQTDNPPTDWWTDSVKQIVAWTQMVNRNFIVTGTGQSVKMNAHNEITNFANAAVHTSSLAPNNKIYALTKSDLAFRVARPYSPIMEEKAGNMWQLKDDFNLFQLKNWQAAQIVLKSRRVHGVINDLINT